MFENLEAGKRIERSTSDGQLREEIEAFNKALYLDKNSSVGSRSRSMGKTQSPDPKSKNRRDNEDQAQKDKKSIWNWKPLKAFSNRNRRFNCCFTLHVHNIENLPSSLEDQSLSVHWKRRDGGLVTHPAQVFQGVAEFEESLMHSCSVNGSRSGPHNSAKYEAKHFLLYAVISSSPEVDLGKHRVDLTRLLPLSLEELEEDKSSGKWTTSFRLSGKGKGATLNVSFRYLVLGDNGKVPGINPKLLDSLNLGKNNPKHFEMNSIRRAESLPNMLNSSQSHAISQELDNVKDLHEVLPERKSFLAYRVDSLSQKFEEEKKPYSNLDDNLGLEVFVGEYETVKSTLSQPRVPDESETEVNGFSVIDQGVELSAGIQVVKGADISFLESRDVVEVGAAASNPITVGVSESVAVVEGMSAGNVVGTDEPAIKEDESISKEALMRDLESALQNVANLEVDSLDSPEAEPGPMRVDFAKGIHRRGKSLSYDDAIASDFLDMIGLEHGLSAESEPESPRERLLRQFEEDARASGCSLYDFGISDDAGTGTIWENRPENFVPPPVIHVPGEEEHQGESKSRMKAKLLENLETEALMLEWGLNENCFQSSPPSNSGPFGSPIHLPSEEPSDLPSLGEGIGPYLQTKNGGFLRSMSPLIFQGAKSGGSLIIQASSPVVVPAQMGSGIMEILNHLASIGIEKLSAQANKLMPIEDITGKTMQQVAREASASLEGPERLTCQTSLVRKGTGDNGGGIECLSLEDLAPLALDKIEALLMEGLRIQSGMSHEEAPSNIHTQSIGEFSALCGTGINLHGRLLDLEGTGGLQLLLDMKDGNDDDDGLMGLSLSLDEWLKLDSGEINDGDRISERTSRILAAHHANSLDYVRGGSKGDRKRGKSKKYGLLGNNFTVALMVQLRDPMRDYEPVGAPMLALVQVERVFVPPRPTIFREVSEVRCENDDVENESTIVVKEDNKEENVTTVIVDEVVPQFQITEVHVAGFRTVPGKKNSWGSSNQQGSRWLLANGMGKSSRNALTRPKVKTTGSKFTGPATTKAQPRDTLWSISARLLGRGNKWKELSDQNQHLRNPDIILPAENSRKLL